MMKDKIIDLLMRRNKALTIYDIKNELKLDSEEELKDLMESLALLEGEYQIYHTNKDRYMLFNNSHLRIGKMITNKKGFGFVALDNEDDIYVAFKNLNGSINGDRVIVEITSPKGLKREGRVLKIIERSIDTLVGTIRFENNKPKVILDDDKVTFGIRLTKDSLKDIVDGHKVVVKLLNQVNNYTYLGEVVRIIGHINDPGIDILSICAKHEINDIFPDEVLRQIETIPSEVSDSELEGRVDLREDMIFTIDGDDTKDIDDAISIERLSNGNYKLGVHIADVSYYVKENSPLDKEAFERGTSIYLADRVIPMLPHKLSNGICSLNPNVDRLTLSCVMEIDSKGNVVDYDIFESVIKSRIQMTYKSVNSILEDNIVPKGYEDYVDSLKLMKELASILRNNKNERGYIDFELDESKIIVDDNGEVIDITLRNRGLGEKLIEDFMIACNETVASHIYHMDYPFIYRVHGEPSEEKIEAFLKFVSILGYQVNGNLNKITPKSLQRLLEQLKEKKEFEILSSQLLRSMQKAVYDDNNIGHFGLASKCYTHFTSPIRRYPDQTVHRLLRKYLFSKDLNKETFKYWSNKLPLIAEHSSIKERQAVECEREVDDMKKAEYMEKHIGDIYEGIISSVVSFGMFIELPNLIEGLVRVEDMIDDYYFYDEATFSFRGKRNKRGYRLGDTVKVRVKSASKEKHTVDFELVIK